MINIISIAIGGAFGSLCRYGMSNGINILLGKGFPYGTLAVNILGSIIMGSAYVLMVERAAVSEELRAGITIGLLGAFTTFSAFSLEAVHMIQKEEVIKALTYVTSSVTLCILAAYLGIVIIRQF